jgi:S-adenosylmethionine-diacylglycerol 3-amino-3-carboxypropyl transferase
MRHLYDFGISQEDPLTELRLLDLKEDDHLLCIASGGEVPLTLLSLRPGLRITAVDIMTSQLYLCRLKLQAALLLPFPLNGQFLGYGKLDRGIRRSLYFDKIGPSLPAKDNEFWIQHLNAIEKGAVNFGRFEAYIRTLRKIAILFIGSANINELLACRTVEEQEKVFDNKIGNRKAVKLIFKIAFHPSVYKNRGLSEQAMQHSKSDTGLVFFNKFRNFCTATPVGRNYFLQYFLAGACMYNQAFPEFLHESNRKVLAENLPNLELKEVPFQLELRSSPHGSFNKVHLSNLGDWMSPEEFVKLTELFLDKSVPLTKACYRYLQKNHFTARYRIFKKLVIIPEDTGRTDRFPFYTVLSVGLKV